jgi:hypothetical protein
MISIFSYIFLYVAFLAITIFAFDFVFLLFAFEPSSQLAIGVLVFCVIVCNGLAFIASERLKRVLSN